MACLSLNRAVALATHPRFSHRATKLFTRGGSSFGSSAAELQPQHFIDSVNSEYEELHKAFETQFWGTKMALASENYSTSELTRTKADMEAFLADPQQLATSRELLSGNHELSTEQTTALKLFERTFSCYIMESETARSLRKKCTEIEGALESARNDLVLGAHLPVQDSNNGEETITTEFSELSSVGLRSRMRVDSDERVREACFEGLREIGNFALSNGFVELVKTRNAMAKTLGYLDYYDYKVRLDLHFLQHLVCHRFVFSFFCLPVLLLIMDCFWWRYVVSNRLGPLTIAEPPPLDCLVIVIVISPSPSSPQVTQAEGFGKDVLFGMLDTLERDTRPLMEAARSRLSFEKGQRALKPWNTAYLMAGETTAKLDPYFPFEKAVENWGRTFSALGIEYRGATMVLDLLDRKRKYANGFCHW